jgi:hypothetical protein
MRKFDFMKVIYILATALAVCLFAWSNASRAAPSENQKIEQAARQCERRGGMIRLVISETEAYMICKDQTRIDIRKKEKK